jgi:lipopolysaccharide export system protein LptC
MLMGLLALGTWWLVKNSPTSSPNRTPAPLRHVADYTMERFTLQRYDATGRLTVSIEGEHLRHFPDTDQLEVDTVHVRAVEADGRVSLATARQGIISGDGSSAQLLGGAHVSTTDTTGQPVDFEGEHLLADLKARTLLSDRPVKIRRSRSEITAEGASYVEATGIVLMQGRTRAVLMPEASSTSTGSPSPAGR